ncbi:hypothetical protein L226DRAFT_527723 [Lentinus tigrinus ALCF2SS1-7]|uniref:uncharacterized protein n=1 Tax=Lentinus tigrinus ALCF2SS1-7 TaxID=1328758 RepID=UPI0011661843|nr:hypothetical protein L226DRAFT_527723 [Lentinus tigrinus ALCF2SS1-7]
MLIDLFGTLSDTLGAPTVDGDYPVRIELSEDTWSSPNMTQYRVYAVRICPLSPPWDREQAASQRAALVLKSPSLGAFMVWIRALTEGDAHLHPFGLSASRRNALLALGRLCEDIGQRNHTRDSSLTPLCRPGDATRLEEIVAALAVWASDYYPRQLTLMPEVIENVDIDNDVSKNPDDFTADPVAEPHASAHGMFPADAIPSSLVPPSDTYSSGMSPTSSHSNPFTPADALQMMSLGHQKDVLEIVDADHDVSDMREDDNSEPIAVLDASAHGMSPADAIASSLVPPSDTYSSGTSPTSLHVTPSMLPDALQMMPTQRKDVPENSDADNDVSEMSDLDTSAHGMSPADAIASSLVPPSDTYSSGMSPTSSHNNSFTPADALQMMSFVHHKDIPENVDADNDVSRILADSFHANPTAELDASTHGLSPADANASSLVLPSDTYSSKMSRTSSHNNSFAPADALRMMHMQPKDVQENSNADDDDSFNLQSFRRTFDYDSVPDLEPITHEDLA